MVYKKNKTRRGLNKKRKQHTRKNLKISKITSKITSEIKKSLKNIQFGGDDNKHEQVGGADGNVILTKVTPNATHHDTTHGNKTGVELTFFIVQSETTDGGHNPGGDNGQVSNGA
jgi:hypothetical protein